MNIEVKKLLDRWGATNCGTELEAEFSKLIEIVILDVIDLVNDEVRYEAGTSVAKIVEHTVKTHYGIK